MPEVGISVLGSVGVDAGSEPLRSARCRGSTVAERRRPVVFSGSRTIQSVIRVG
jgi:hypothetical protein